MNITFKKFISEVVTDSDTLSDPKLRNDLIRRMRTDDPDRGERMDARLQRDIERKQRKELTQAEDPKKKQLLRKKMMLQKQIDFVNQQIKDLSASSEETQGTE